MNNNKSFYFKKSLGQNFIYDENILKKIVEKAHISKEDFVLEIGAGDGSLTKFLIDNSKFLISFEIDERLIPTLNKKFSSCDNFHLIHADFLTYNFNTIIDFFNEKSFNIEKKSIKVVANIPYYITSKIIMSLLSNDYIDTITLMMQKEVADRITSNINSKKYGILTVITNYYAHAKILFTVNKECFFPSPKVDSSVITLTKHNNYNFSRDFENNLFKIINYSFNERRKKVVNSISNVSGFDKNKILNVFSKLNLDENLRAENLTLENYITITKELF